MKKTIVFIMTLTLMSMMLSAQSQGGRGNRQQNPTELVSIYNETLELNEEQKTAFLEILTYVNEEFNKMMESGSRDRDKMMALMAQRDMELLAYLDEQQSELFADMNDEMSIMGGRRE